MRLLIGISYQGTYYHGWQTQLGLRTIQSTIEVAVAKVANQPITLICAGRTDKGVHALGQVAHFDSTAKRSERSWLLGINSHLPSDIRIDWVREVAINFHARFSAMARQYHYLIYNQPMASALWNQQTTHFHHPLNVQLMQLAANYLVGEHDFSSFRALGCQSKSSYRHIHHLRITYTQKKIILIDIKANAFLYHMVRNIVGVLMLVGTEKRKPSWVETVLLAKNRTKASITAPPNGLYLAKVFYPECFSIPNNTIFLL